MGSISERRIPVLTGILLLVMASAPWGGDMSTPRGIVYADPSSGVLALRSAPVTSCGSPTKQVVPIIRNSLQGPCPIGYSETLASSYVATCNRPVLAQTEVFTSDPSGPYLFHHVIDTSLQSTVDTIGIDGIPLLSEDLDRDGRIELLVQYGDEIRFYGEPGWNSRGLIAFGGMNVKMSPVAVDIMGDSCLEIFVTPNDLGGNSLAVIIAMNSSDGGFSVIESIPASYGTTGTPAACDFDDDGRVEFIVGDFEGYTLYEWQDTGLARIGPVGSSGGAMNYFGSVVRPLPGRKPMALLGYSIVNSGIFRYELLAPSGDNAFSLFHVFEDYTGFVGIQPNRGADTDCDGMDELAMAFPPSPRIYEWDPNSATFFESCGFVGSTEDWYLVDLDQDGALEWGTITSSCEFAVLSDSSCLPCSDGGKCILSPACGCLCFADPSCDGIRSDITDVVATIDEAFRGALAPADPSAYCPVQPSDVDCDGAITIVDVVLTVDVAFRAGVVEAIYCHPCASY